MNEPAKYPTARGVELAIKEAAKRAHGTDPSVSVGDRIRQAHFDRFLCRIFSEGEDSKWVLKGGTGMLARVPNARATLDIDLYRSGVALDQSLEDLTRLASADLHDHFRFIYEKHRRVIPGDAQPYVDGYRVIFHVYLGVKELSPLGVDLAVGVGVTDAVSVVTPANRLDLPRLETTDYRLYPIVDQIADKVCATMDKYPQGSSSRTKDLVDLVMIGNSHDIDAAALRTAIDAERRRRGINPFKELVVPENWGPTYAKTARVLPCCAKHQNIEDAMALMARFIDPVLGDGANGSWDHQQLQWR